MSDKLFIICIASAIGFLIGKSIHSRCVKSRLFYDGLCDFSADLLQNLSFRQDNFPSFIDNLEERSNKVFVRQLDYLRSYMNGNNLIVVEECEKMDVAEISEFFEKIGTLDLFTQIEEVKGEITSFQKMRERAIEKEKKKGETAIKIGLLCGFAIGILLI